MDKNDCFYLVPFSLHPVSFSSFCFDYSLSSSSYQSISSHASLLRPHSLPFLFCVHFLLPPPNLSLFLSLSSTLVFLLSRSLPHNFSLSQLKVARPSSFPSLESKSNCALPTVQFAFTSTVFFSPFPELCVQAASVFHLIFSFSIDRLHVLRFNLQANFSCMSVPMPSVFCFEFLIARRRLCVHGVDNFMPFRVGFALCVWPHDLKLLILITFQFMAQLN